jgi:predicted RNA-binding protein with PUA-like domain
MAYWLLKSEPATWSWDDQVKAGAKGTAWEGVRNHVAKKNLKAMQRGERAFFYHSGEEKRIVGIVEIISPYRPDPSDKTGVFGLVDVNAIAPLPKPVTLADCRTEAKLAKMALLHYPRLSVQPVADAEWAFICRLGGLKNA